MKTIKLKELLRVIRKEYKEARRWAQLDFGHYYKLMINTSDAEVWADCFLDKNSWKEYKSTDVKCLGPMDGGGTVSEIEQKFLNIAVELLEEAGWTITQ